MPFNGSNQHSVVVMDNCAAHHIRESVSMIEKVGALVHLLLPHSLDLKEAFSKVKYTIMSLEMALDTIDVQTSCFCNSNPEWLSGLDFCKVLIHIIYFTFFFLSL